MIELHVGPVSAPAGAVPAFPVFERGMPPERVVEFARSLVEAYGDAEHRCWVSTVSHFAVQVFNNALSAYRSGKQVATPPLDPAQLEVAIHWPGNEGAPGTRVDGLNERGLIDETYFTSVSESLLLEAMELEAQV